jgi:hypothetical protein
MYLGVDAAGVLKIAAPSEQPPLEFRLTNVGDDVVLNTEALDDFGELWPFSLCVVDGDGSGRVTLCDLLSEEEEDETTTRTPRAARWQEIVPALDDDEGHVSIRSVANDGFIRHSVFEVFAQADTGPPFTADASWIAEQSPAATTE